MNNMDNMNNADNMNNMYHMNNKLVLNCGNAARNGLIMNTIDHTSDKLYVFACKGDVPNVMKKTLNNLHVSWVLGICKGLTGSKMIEETGGFIIISSAVELSSELFVKRLNINTFNIEKVDVNDHVISRIIQWAVKNDACVVSNNYHNNKYHDLIAAYLTGIRSKTNNNGLPIYPYFVSYDNVIDGKVIISEKGTDKYLINAIYYISGNNPDDIKINPKDVKFPKLDDGDFEKLPVVEVPKPIPITDEHSTMILSNTNLLQKIAELLLKIEGRDEAKKIEAKDVESLSK